MFPKGLVSINVQPNAKENKLITEDGTLKLFLAAPPDKGKANAAVVKFFKKKYNLKVEIIRGLKGRNKILRIL